MIVLNILGYFWGNKHNSYAALIIHNKSQKTKHHVVTIYFLSKQLLLFGFAEQNKVSVISQVYVFCVIYTLFIFIFDVSAENNISLMNYVIIGITYRQNILAMCCDTMWIHSMCRIKISYSRFLYLWPQFPHVL